MAAYLRNGWQFCSELCNYKKILESKGTSVDETCVTKIFTRWKVKDFESKYVGDIRRLLEAESVESEEPISAVRQRGALRMDKGFIGLLQSLEHESVALSHPGVFLFLPYLKRLKIYEKAASLIEVDPERGYSWFSLLLVNLGRILAGISSVSKACRSDEPSVPLMGGLVGMPSKDSVLNGLAEIGEGELLSLRRYLTAIAAEQGLIEGKRIVFDFHARDFTGYDVELKSKRSMKYTPRPGWRGSGRRPPTRFARTNGQAARPGSNVPDSCIATAGRRSVDSGGGSVRMTQRERNRLCRKQSAEELREICLSPREIVAQSRVPDDAPTYAW